MVALIALVMIVLCIFFPIGAVGPASTMPILVAEPAADMKGSETISTIVRTSRVAAQGAGPPGEGDLNVSTAKTLKNCHSVVLGTTRTGKLTMFENLILMINTDQGDQSPAAY